MALRSGPSFAAALPRVSRMERVKGETCSSPSSAYGFRIWRLQACFLSIACFAHPGGRRDRVPNLLDQRDLLLHDPASLLAVEEVRRAAFDAAGDLALPLAVYPYRHCLSGVKASRLRSSPAPRQKAQRRPRDLGECSAVVIGLARRCSSEPVPSLFALSRPAKRLLRPVNNGAFWARSSDELLRPLQFCFGFVY